jgi:hypothetical protein
MKYTKPQITNTATASFAIMQLGKIGGSSDNPVAQTSLNPAYSADE